MTVDRTASLVAAFIGREVRDDLVTVEIEVDPIRRATAFGTTQEFTVEAARFGDVANGKCKVEWNALR